MDTLNNRYTNIIHTYHIELANDVTVTITQEVDRPIYGAAQEGVPPMFLQWNIGAGGHDAQVVLL